MTINTFIQADRELQRSLAGRALVTFDRFTSAGRTAFTGPFRISAAKPRLSFGYYTRPKYLRGAFVALEQNTGSRDGNSKHAWLGPLRNEIIDQCRSLETKPVFAAWYASDELVSIASEVGAVLITAARDIRENIEDKLNLNGILEGAGIEDSLIIPSRNISNPGTHLYHEITRAIGEPFIFQVPHSSGGRGTFIIASEDQYYQVASTAPNCKVSKYIVGFSSNTTVLTVPSGNNCAVYVDVPSHKAVGVTTLGISPTKGAGNDWSQSWPKRRLQRFVSSIVQIGRYLYKEYGLIGLWGVDSIWHRDGVVVNEINVRNQGTTELSSLNQGLVQQMPSFLVAHLVIHLGGTVTWLPTPDEFNLATIQHTSAISPMPFYVKLRNTSDKALQVRPKTRGSGVYWFLSDGTLEWVRPSMHPLHANLDKKQILLANVPAAHTSCTPGAEIGTIEGVTTKPIFLTPSRLTQFTENIAKGVMRYLFDE